MSQTTATRKPSNRSIAAVVAGAMSAIRAPSADAIAKRLESLRPIKGWLFVDGEGKAYILVDGSETQVSKAHTHLGMLVGVYGGKDAVNRDQIRADIAAHMQKSRG